ncbi:MAG: hypothetical protein RL367_1577 [Pseudomonadota bacterium]
MRGPAEPACPVRVRHQRTLLSRDRIPYGYETPLHPGKMHVTHLFFLMEPKQLVNAAGSPKYFLHCSRGSPVRVGVDLRLARPPAPPPTCARNMNNRSSKPRFRVKCVKLERKTAQKLGRIIVSPLLSQGSVLRRTNPAASPGSSPGSVTSPAGLQDARKSISCSDCYPGLCPPPLSPCGRGSRSIVTSVHPVATTEEL